MHNLKLATENDWPHVLRMAKSFHETSPYGGLEFSEASCRAMFDKYLKGDRRELIVILAGEIPYGMIVGYSSSLPFSLDRVAMELAWWVDEDKRGTKESLLLFKAYEDWCVRIDCKIAQMAMLDDVTNLRKFYLKQGYRPAEQSFIKEL